MKSPALLLILALAPAVLLVSGGCTKTDKDNAASVVQDIKATAVDTWESVKDFTFEQRTDFSASIDRMCRSMDNEIEVVKAKASSTPGAAAADREAAVKDYDAARVDLKTSLANLNNATAADWSDAKEKVAAAWRRVKADYDKATQ
jgi:outer membrane murein-binding lipoprotein Lpp